MQTAALASDQTRPLLMPPAVSARPVPRQGQAQMQATTQAQTAAGAASKPDGEAADEGGIGFSDVLSMLNPLQYLPVVGPIYRAATGDTIPEAVRVAGSLVVSGLLGGPVGVAVSAALNAFFHLVGFSADDMAHTALASLGLVSDSEAGPKQAAVEPATNVAANAAGGGAPWSRIQRAAYGLVARDAVTPARSLVAASLDTGARHLATAAYTRTTRTAAAPLVSLAA